MLNFCYNLLFVEKKFGKPGYILFIDWFNNKIQIYYVHE